MHYINLKPGKFPTANQDPALLTKNDIAQLLNDIHKNEVLVSLVFGCHVTKIDQLALRYHCYKQIYQ
jgi:hypothetical protein